MTLPVKSDTAAVREVLTRGLRRLYWSHQQASRQERKNSQLVSATELHTQLNRSERDNLKQAVRLESVFRLLDLKVMGDFDPAMRGIVEDNRDANIEATGPLALDFGVISSGRLIAHHFLAAYKTHQSYCEILAEWEAARLLGATLDEILAAEQRLLVLARQALMRAARTTRVDDCNAPAQ